MTAINFAEMTEEQRALFIEKVGAVEIATDAHLQMTESPELTSFQRVPRARKITIAPQRKQLILNFIHEYIRVKGMSPTYQKIGEGIGFHGKSGGKVHTLVQELIAEGWLIKVDPNSARALQPVYPADKVYCALIEPTFKKVARLQHDLKILT